MRLRAAGMRPVSNIVDATNYVMLEMGKPTHAFDAAAVHDATIVVRRARTGERLETLDHVERDLDPETLVIADPRGPLAIAGVMGGAASEVTDGTTEVVIESAIFDPVSIRRAGKRFALRSEASLRFEKGQDVPTARVGADRVAQLVAAWAGGSVLRGRLDTDPAEPGPRSIAFRPARVSRILGTDAHRRRAVRAPGPRRHRDASPRPATAVVPVAAGDEPLTVSVDGVDGAGRPRADVAARHRDRGATSSKRSRASEGTRPSPPGGPRHGMPAYRPSPLVVRDVVREALVGAGLVEVITHALVAPRSVEQLAWPDDGDLPLGEVRSGGPVITVRNPLAAQHSVLRQHVVPSLLDVLATNERHGRERIALFEVGKGYARGEDGPREWWRVAFVLSGAAEPAAWMRPARPYDLDDAKAIVELLAEQPLARRCRRSPRTVAACRSIRAALPS